MINNHPKGLRVSHFFFALLTSFVISGTYVTPSHAETTAIDASNAITLKADYSRLKKGGLSPTALSNNSERKILTITASCSSAGQPGQTSSTTQGCEVDGIEGAVAPADEEFFVTTWKTDNPGTSVDDSMIIPIVGGPWGLDVTNDGIVDFPGLDGAVELEWVEAGTYTIRIIGDHDSIRFANGGDKEKIVSLDQWGTHSWKSMNSAFYGASNMQVLATDTPDFSAVTDMESIFDGATVADPDTSGWNTAAVTNMDYMFWDAVSARPDTSNWNTSMVTSMRGMFVRAVLANPDTTNWDTSEVLNMYALFTDASSANPDTRFWNTAKVTDMELMFSGATSANPDTSGWDVSSLANATGMFNGIALSQSNYERLLTRWNDQVLLPGVTFDGGNSTYCLTAAADARTNMMSSDGWVITDGGEVCTPGVDFVTTWKTFFPGASGNTSITVPMVGGPYEVDWDNDGSFDEMIASGPASHDFGLSGTYTIRIRGVADSISFNGGGDKLKILSVDQWGSNAWTTMANAFREASNLTVPASDVPDFSAVTDMSYMFGSAVLANPDTSNWDTSKVMSMSRMFFEADSATPNTSDWDTSEVTSMFGMFENTSSANPDTTDWDTSKVLTMQSMFFNASSANPDTSGWDTSSVSSMDNMFFLATAFDRDIGGWDVSSLTSAAGMFTGVTLSVTNYSRLLEGWGAQDLQSGVFFSGGNSTYCSLAAENARAKMTFGDGWSITDGGESCNPGDYFVTAWKTDNPGTSSNTSITVPMVGGPYDVDWNNDGVFDERVESGPASRDLGSSGTYTITIRGMFDSIRFNDGGDKMKILSVDQWGSNAWTTMANAFQGASNLTVPASDVPDFSAVTDMQSMFAGAILANPDTSNWNTSNVKNMHGMFSNAASANPDTSTWDTSDVLDTSRMFENASSASPDTGGWDVSSLADATDMFAGVALDSDNYDSLLTSWNAQALQPGVTFGGGNSTYCSLVAENARANMISSDGWQISDGGECSRDIDFVTTWKTDNPGTSDNNSITVPMVGGPYDVDWNNDGSFDESVPSGPVGHTFAAPGTYTIRIRGAFDSIEFDYEGDNLKILSLDQWGNNAWTTMTSAFRGAENLEVPASDVPDFSAVTDMSLMFAFAYLANPNTRDWDTSKVRNMTGMFRVTQNANPDTSGWDTSSVKWMVVMFEASNANPDTSGWDTSSVIDTFAMFSYAYSANPDTSGWNTSKLKNANSMFSNARSFDGDISGWDVSSLEDASDMFRDIALSSTNYDSLLTAWNAQVLKPGVNFGGGNSIYCSQAAVGARANMVSSDGWQITDGGAGCPPDNPTFPPDLTPETDTEDSDSDNITANTTPDFFVQCSTPGNTITLYTTRGWPWAVGQHVCSGSGIETASVTEPLRVGVQNISYTDASEEGPSGHSPFLEVTILPGDLIYGDGFEVN